MINAIREWIWLLFDIAQGVVSIAVLVAIFLHYYKGRSMELKVKISDTEYSFSIGMPILFVVIFIILSSSLKP